LGIGLTLVKNLVEMHGGTVTAHSEGLGKGSEFVIRIPVLAEIAKERDTIDISEPAEPLAGKLRILVVDDNEDSAESLALLLKISGHEVEMANDGMAAVEMATSFAPEVILLDIGLPKLNGYEAARAIRERPNGGSINLIALTGWGQEEDRQRSKDAGFDGHMVKPVDHVELMKRLEDLASKKNGR
jgi:CheY-like chemotaxis protein